MMAPMDLIHYKPMYSMHMYVAIYQFQRSKGKQLLRTYIITQRQELPTTTVLAVVVVQFVSTESTVFGLLMV